ncbi:MAG: 1-acyl-sn-glycerol-3-phosphate acyltransferase [Granulosicoccus sp.]|jgi:1-acyl-sn-glycerol-3-phosphate acyltransferase
MQENEISLDLYTDEEVQQGIQEIFQHEKFIAGMKAFLPENLYEHIIKAKDNVQSIYDFQATITKPFLKTIQQISIAELTVSGLENLNQDDKYLFISNHRDIVLDSAYLNLLLFENQISTSQIAIGDNLMKSRASELLFRINKSFVVKREGTPRELYAHSIELSKYIQRMISEKVDSVWIAQREGRAKDGNDRTQPGLLKMISLSGGKMLKEHFQNLKVVPVAISYEFDPTGLLKTQEFLNKKRDPDFQKSFKEDLNNMLLGIRGKKGKVHFDFGKPLNEELEVLDTAKNGKQQLEFLTNIIDRSIHTNYRLNPVNYVAYDWLHASTDFEDKYSPEEKEKYTQFFQNQIDQLTTDEQADGLQYLLGMYANPVVNANQYED